MSARREPLDPSPAALERDALRLLDQRARRAALDPQRSLLLQAPAGSGKTTVLTARFLTLLATVEVPEEIVAITFTRKAAAEMRQRILAAVQAEQADEAPRGIDPQLLETVRQRDRQLRWQLRDNPARLRIQTVDALNHWLAQAQPVAARSAATLHIDDAPATLYRLAARRCLQGAWSDPGLRPVAELLFARLDNGWARLEALLAQMLARRAHWLPRLLHAGEDGLGPLVRRSLDSIVRSELAHVMARLPSALLEEGRILLAHGELLRAQAAQARGRQLAPERPGPLSAEAADLARWRALVGLALTADGWRCRFTQVEGFGRDERAVKQRAAVWVAALRRQPEAEALLESVCELPDPELPAADEQALEALAPLLQRAAAELKLVFAERGRVDHTEVAAAARASLTEQGDPSEFALRAGGAVRHILVDEFQDTSLEQFEMLRTLTAAWGDGDGRTLFLVGDPMQSIYQFREAEVGLFLRARDQGLGELRFESLQLRRNFRARAALIDWINVRFARLFPLEDDARAAAIRYLPSVPADAADRASADPATAAVGGTDASALGSSAVVALHRFGPGDYLGEAQRVLEIVRRERARDPAVSIAVLVASREHAVPIAERMHAAALPVRGVDLEPLRDRHVVRDLAALTRALLHGADRGAWLAMLRAPWCGLTLAQLEWLCAQPQDDLFATLLAHAAPHVPGEAAAGAGGVTDHAGSAAGGLRAPLARVAAALRPALLGEERALPLWQRVERCWLRLAGPAIYPREVDRMDARRFVQALATHDLPDTLVGEALAEITDGLYSAAPPRADAIDIMTMHAAKGLEWDVVILPALGRATARDRDPLLHWLDLPRADGGTDLLLAPIRAAASELSASVGGYIKAIRRRRRRIERVRLLYVAATRARRALHLLGALQPQSQPGPPPRPAPGSPLELLWPAIAAEFLGAPLPVKPATGGLCSAEQGVDPDAPGESAAATTTAPAVSAGKLLRLPAEWIMPPPPPLPAVLRWRSPAPPADLVPEYRWVGLTARAVGTIVHAELHRLAGTHPLPQAHVVLQQLPDYRPWLAELDVPALEHAPAQQRIGQALERTLSDARGRWLLASDHAAAQSEWRLTGVYEERLVSVVFDRMLIDAPGQRWVVDFKTSRHEGAGQEEFIDAEMERYRAQLVRYAALARALGPQPVRVALYFPLLGVFRELTPAP